MKTRGPRFDDCLRRYLKDVYAGLSQDLAAAKGRRRRVRERAAAVLSGAVDCRPLRAMTEAERNVMSLCLHELSARAFKLILVEKIGFATPENRAL